MEAWKMLDAKDLNKTLSSEELRALEKAKAAIAGEGGRIYLTFEELLSVLEARKHLPFEDLLSVLKHKAE